MPPRLLIPLHAGHWLWDGLYAAPVVLLALAFGVQALRRRLRGEPPPDDLEDDERLEPPGLDR